VGVIEGAEKKEEETLMKGRMKINGVVMKGR